MKTISESGWYSNAELHIPVIRGKLCDECQDRFECWTNKVLSIQAHHVTTKIDEDISGTRVEFIFSIPFSRGCIEAATLYRTVSNHNTKKPSIFYGNLSFRVLSQELATNFNDGTTTLTIKAKII